MSVGRLHIRNSALKARPVFLDFVNREASRGTGQIRDESCDIDILRTLITALPYGLSANISQLTEYSHDRPYLLKTLMKLMTAGIVDVTSSAGSMDEFLGDVQGRYSHVPDRYPFYFGGYKEFESIEIGTRNDFSMTRMLGRSLLSYEPGNFQRDLIRANRNDQVAFDHGHRSVISKIFNREELAITRDLFETNIGNVQMSSAEIDAASRIVSSLYMQLYADKRGLATPTGIPNFPFTDIAANFPSFDYPILRFAIVAVGGAKLLQKIPTEEMIEHYKSTSHLNFSYYLEAFLESCVTMLRSGLSYPIEFETTRVLLKQLLLRELNGEEIGVSKGPNAFYELAQIRLINSGERLRKSNASFAGKWSEYMKEESRGVIVITTATDSEDQALFAVLKEFGFSRSRLVRHGVSMSQEFRRHHNQKIVHVRTSAGSYGVNSAGGILGLAIKDLSAQYVISTGICFGLKPSFKGHGEQEYGDILISSEIEDYETVRQGEQFEFRGEKLPAGPGLLSAARIARDQFHAKLDDDNEFQIFEGLMLSGQKLIDDEAFISRLVQAYPKAIGGEMEGNAIASSAIHAGRQWIMIKGICDWGMKKEDDWQALAAERACKLAVKTAINVLTTEDV